MTKVVVIGAGAMGLAAAYHVAKLGHEVDVLEAAPEAGGMAAHFDLAGLSIERYYHFVCKADAPTFELMDELGIGDRMRWVETSMGYYIDGALHPWGDPLSLLRFPKLSLIEKLRYAAMMFTSVKRSDWSRLDQISGKEWITRWCGAEVYDRLWAPLFELKFHEFADDVSAAWLWTRIRRIGTSRRSAFQEELGYIAGGTETLVQALVNAICKSGGAIHLATPATRVIVENGRVAGVAAGDRVFPAEAVISTAPTPFVSRLAPDLPAADIARYEAIRNLGVVCVAYRLRRSVSRNFWINISDSRFEIPGVVEFSNLRKVDGAVIYIPYYMPPSHPKFSRDDDYFRKEGMDYLKLLNPNIVDADLIAFNVSRLRHAQPVCTPGFGARLPPVETAIKGLQIADTCFYYPEDRAISDSVRLGKIMAQRIGARYVRDAASRA